MLSAPCWWTFSPSKYILPRLTSQIATTRRCCSRFWLNCTGMPVDKTVLADVSNEHQSQKLFSRHSLNTEMLVVRTAFAVITDRKVNHQTTPKTEITFMYTLMEFFSYYSEATCLVSLLYLRIYHINTNNKLYANTKKYASQTRSNRYTLRVCLMAVDLWCCYCRHSTARPRVATSYTVHTVECDNSKPGH